MSPSPTLRATSTSRPSSIENIARPSTSDGVEAGVVDRQADGLARERQLGVGQALAERGLADADDRGAVLDRLRSRRLQRSRPAGRYQPFHSGSRFSIIAAMRSLPSSVRRFSSM